MFAFWEIPHSASTLSTQRILGNQSPFQAMFVSFTALFFIHPVLSVFDPQPCPPQSDYLSSSPFTCSTLKYTHTNKALLDRFEKTVVVLNIKKGRKTNEVRVRISKGDGK